MITSTPRLCLRDQLVHLWLPVEPVPGVLVTECGLSIPDTEIAEDREGPPCLACLVTAGERIPANDPTRWRD